MFNAQRAAFALFVGTTAVASAVVGPVTTSATSAMPHCTSYGTCFYLDQYSVNCSYINIGCGCVYYGAGSGVCVVKATLDE